MDEKVNILLIDDDEVDRALVKRALKGTEINYSITECVEAGSAIVILKEEQFDCVFLDYLLPGTDGLKLLKKLRAEGINTPIVIITSQGDEKIAVDMMKAGATDYVIKTNLNSHSISQIIRNAIRLQEIEVQRERTEIALKESEARLAEAQRIARLGNWEYDCQSKSIYWSAEMFRIFDRDPKEYRPDINNFFDIYHPEEIELIKNTIKNAFSGDSFNVDFKINSSNEVQKYCNTQGHTLLDENNKPVKIIGTVQDITNRKQVEQELIKAKQLTEETSRAKEQFLANMSHEIRTPMNAIVGFARILLQENFPPEQKKYVEAICNSGENLLVIINEILDFSKIASGKLHLEESPFLLQQVVNSIMEMFLEKAEGKNILLSAEIEEDVPTRLLGDPVRLNQVLINLVSNAIKFTEAGFIRLSIHLLKEDEEAVELRFMIEDTGIGIPENKLDTIFESFTQASNDTSRKFGGTGLGLTIAKNIIELQGGQVKVSSQEGIGSTFAITSRYKKDNLGETSNDRPKRIEEEEVYETLNGLRVLVAEDNSVNQLLIKTVLQKAGCEVDIAENGRIVLEKLQQSVYDLIIMDIQMPEMDGYQATQLIRTTLAPPLSEIPIMAMTAHALSSEVDKCLGMGMNDYISKPFNTRNLYSKMAQLVPHRKDPSKKEADSDQEIKVNGSTSPELTPNNSASSALSSTANTPEEKIVNFDSIIAYTDGDAESTMEIVQVFMSEAPKNIEELLRLYEEENWDSLRLLAHKCKSSYGMMGVKILNELMKSLENLCKAEEIDAVAIKALIDEVVAGNEKAVYEMQNELEALKKTSDFYNFYLSSDDIPVLCADAGK